jgi:Domain of unknown function (DUF397)
MTLSEFDAAIFRRSTFCAKDACVEVAVTSNNEFLVRDGKDRRADAPVLRFDAEEWRAFALGMAAGEFSAER